MSNSELAKQKGNKEFKAGNYVKAIEFYSHGISMNTEVSILYSNRAMCYKKTKDFEMCRADSLRALELDEGNIKAHMLYGISLCEAEKTGKHCAKVHEGIERLSKALGLCVSKNVRNFEKDLEVYILRAKKLAFYLELEEREQEEMAVVEQLRKADGDTPQLKTLLGLLESKRPKMGLLPGVICPISHVIMTDPVIVPSGRSYQKGPFLSYLDENGWVSPDR